MSLKNLSKDLVNLIANFCSPLTIARWSATSQRYRSFLLKHAVLVGWKDLMKRKSNRFCAEQAAQNGFCDMVKLLISRDGMNQKTIDSVINYACLGGHYDDAFEEQYEVRDIETAMKFAARGGHAKLFHKLLSKYPHPPDPVFWDSLLPAAAQGGVIALVNLCIECGSTYWEGGLYGALEGGHMDLVKFFIDKGAKNYYLHGLMFAMRGGHQVAVDFLLNHINMNEGVTIHWDANLSCAARKGHRHFVDLCIQKGAMCWDDALEMAAAGGHSDLIHLFIEKGANIFPYVLQMAEQNGHLDIVKMLLDYK